MSGAAPGGAGEALALSELLQPECSTHAACQLMIRHRSGLHHWLTSDQLLQAAAQPQAAPLVVQALSYAWALAPHLGRWACAKHLLAAWLALAVLVAVQRRRLACPAGSSAKRLTPASPTSRSCGPQLARRRQTRSLGRRTHCCALSAAAASRRQTCCRCCSTSSRACAGAGCSAWCTCATCRPPPQPSCTARWWERRQLWPASSAGGNAATSCSWRRQRPGRQPQTAQPSCSPPTAPGSPPGSRQCTQVRPPALPQSHCSQHLVRLVSGVRRGSLRASGQRASAQRAQEALPPQALGRRRGRAWRASCCRAGQALRLARPGLWPQRACSRPCRQPPWPSASSGLCSWRGLQARPQSRAVVWRPGLARRDLPATAACAAQHGLDLGPCCASPTGSLRRLRQISPGGRAGQAHGECGPAAGARGRPDGCQVHRGGLRHHRRARRVCLGRRASHAGPPARPAGSGPLLAATQCACLGCAEAASQSRRAGGHGGQVAPPGRR